MTDKKLSYKAKGETAITVDYLRSLVAGLEKQRVIISSVDDEMVLYPGAEIDFKVKAKIKKGEAEIEIKLAWKQESSSPEIVITN